MSTGPLRPHPQNPRYFTDGSGRAIYLTGSHTWSNLQDQGPKDPPTPLRLRPLPRLPARAQPQRHPPLGLGAGPLGTLVRRQGPEPLRLVHQPEPVRAHRAGKALDGKPKFDLEKWDDAYFDRLRSRVRQAGDRGIYVSVMLFQGWSSAKGWLGGTPWRGHPYHPDNNVQGWSGNTKGDTGPALDDPRIRERQAAYIRKVVDTLNDLDNVLYEVTNEGGYQGLGPVRRRHGARLREDEAQAAPGRPHRPRLGEQRRDAREPRRLVLAGLEPWPDLKSDPRAVDGKKLSLLDTDHVFGVGGDQKWVWKSFLRGHNVLFMDPYDDPAWAPILAGQGVGVRDAEAARRAMGHARRYAERIDLAASRPAGELASTRYCLAVPGREYLVYLPDGGAVTVDLSAAKGKLSAEWMHPITGKITPGEAVEGGGKRTLKAPFAGDAVLFVRAVP